MNWYFKLIANHPGIIILIVGVFSITTLALSINSMNLLDFSDPQQGFETRGSEIAKRLTAWDNLHEATRPSGLLTVNPNADSLLKKVITTHLQKKKKVNISYFPEEDFKKKIRKKLKFKNRKPLELFKNSSNFKENLIHQVRQDHKHDHLSSDKFFCEGLSPEYSHMVVESVNSTQSLFSLDALLSICIMQEKLMRNKMIGSICQTISSGHCCKPWSLPNYISMLYNHTGCLDITEYSITQAKVLLSECSKYYNNLQLNSDCDQSQFCQDVPEKCKKFNAVHNILYYLTDTDFLSANHSFSADVNNDFLKNTMIFLPIARSSAVLPYYYSLSESELKHETIHITAMDLGLKYALFNDWLMTDALLMIAGGCFIFLCIWIYTHSLFITVSTILAIIMSLINSYFIYTFFFHIKFFPFMNLLAVIVAIGIGADDVFIFHKIWKYFSLDKSNFSAFEVVSCTLKHSFTSMFVTSLTTAAAFYSSSLGSITAINCFRVLIAFTFGFSVFAATAVFANFLLMISWLPACFVISEKHFCLLEFNLFSSVAFSPFKNVWKYVLKTKSIVEQYFAFIIIRLKWLWLFVFTATAIVSAIVVLYYPKLRLPDSKNFHLFHSGHLFERYDLFYREKFWFEKSEKVSRWDDTNSKLPLRFVWGINPVDNGNHYEPSSKGTLEFDQTFDIAAPESQAWLLRFCRLLRMQSFYQSTQGPLLPNCFIESFKNWMERRCKDAVDNIDRTPCCQSSKFPYSREVFGSCIIQAMSSLFETPADYFLPGVAGPKFSKTDSREIKVVVVEYDSNHSRSMSFKEMHDFYMQVETWFQEQLISAPPGMKNGWFISNFDFYDLQLALSDGTSIAIGVSMFTSLAVFFLISLNLLISFYTIITISCVIFVTIGFLVSIGWSLNVLESVAVTTAIGLAVDFSLHYGINFSLSIDDNRESSVRYTLNRMGGPTLMAALTTGAAGIFMLPSKVLAYVQIGVFLLIVMTSSWLYSSIFLMSLLSVIGPRKGFGQFSYKAIFSICRNKKGRNSAKENTDISSNVLLSKLNALDNISINKISNEILEMDSVVNNDNSNSSLSKMVYPIHENPL